MSVSMPSTGTLRLGGASVGACLWAFVLMGASQALHGPALPGLAARFAIDPATAALVVGAHWVGALLAVSSLFSTRLDESLPARPAIACAAIGAGALAVAHAPAFGAVLCGSAAVGAGYGWLTVGLNGLFARGAAGRGPVMLNLLNAAFGIGAIVAPLAMAGLGLDYRAAFDGLGIGALLVAPILARTDHRQRGTGSAGGPARVGGRKGLTATETVTLLAVGTIIAFEASLAAWGPGALRAAGLDATLGLSAYCAVFLGARLAAAALSVVAAPRTLLLVPARRRRRSSWRRRCAAGSRGR